MWAKINLSGRLALLEMGVARMKIGFGTYTISAQFYLCVFTCLLLTTSQLTVFTCGRVPVRPMHPAFTVANYIRI